jgi:hypothetical protein
MKCLSVRNPYAGAIVLGRKPIEYRTWRTKYTGKLLIHASKTIDEFAIFVGTRVPVMEAKGCIVGCANLVECVLGTLRGEKTWFWYLDQPFRFNVPIPYRGQVGLFNVPDEIIPA